MAVLMMIDRLCEALTSPRTPPRTASGAVRVANDWTAGIVSPPPGAKKIQPTAACHGLTTIA
jgi:hypothetical protein